MMFDLTTLARRDGLNARLIVSPAVLNYLQADGDNTRHWKHTLGAASRSIAAVDTEGGGTGLVTLSAERDSDSIRVFIVVQSREGVSVATIKTPSESFR